MKRTKEWWSTLTKAERIRLVHLERVASQDGRSAYLAPDCSECGSCSTPHSGWGLCPSCADDLDQIISKADLALTARLNKLKGE